jgi:hypothetical protein
MTRALESSQNEDDLVSEVKKDIKFAMQKKTVAEQYEELSTRFADLRCQFEVHAVVESAKQEKLRSELAFAELVNGDWTMEGLEIASHIDKGIDSEDDTDE